MPAHPLKTCIIAESKIKTDRVDAKILARLLETGFLTKSFIPCMEINDLLNQVRRRIFLGKYIGYFVVYPEVPFVGYKFKKIRREILVVTGNSLFY